MLADVLRCMLMSLPFWLTFYPYSDLLKGLFQIKIDTSKAFFL